MDQFYKLEKELILQKKKMVTSRGWFQYRQVLVSALMRKINVFKPLTVFELVLKSVGEPKLLSTVYKVLLLNVRASEHIKVC